MLKTIIAKEFLNNILNLRFMIGLVLCIIVTIACIVILAHEYRQELAEYNLRVNSQDESASKYARGRRLPEMLQAQKPPERFRPLIVGIRKDVGSSEDDPLPILFPPFDFVFIVTVIMSLLAILFSYDAITEERQSGTLRLMISNSLPRTKILLAKWIGGTITLSMPFLLSLLAGAIYISINPSIQWDGSAWAEFALLTAASITFITLFYILGLMVSSFSRYSSNSILNCLFLWVLLILVIPNICPYISAQLYRIPSIREIEKRDKEISNQTFHAYWESINKIVKRFRSRYGKLFSELESMEFGKITGEGDVVQLRHREATQQRAAADPEFKAMMNAFGEETEKATDIIGPAQEEIHKLWNDLRMKAALQTKLAKNMACISPYANFVYLATDLTGTGLRSLEYFGKARRRYRNELKRYGEKKMQKEREENPAFGEQSLMDVSDRPRFVFKEEALKDKLIEVLPYWGILVVFNVVFFVAAFAGFMRYDVR
jgi:ABC-type transport system involved in multi-copper enzyme maturation permease subunit